MCLFCPLVCRLGGNTPSASGVCMALSKHICFMYSVVIVWFCTSISRASYEASCWVVGLVSPGDTSGALQEIQRRFLGWHIHHGAQKEPQLQTSYFGNREPISCEETYEGVCAPLWGMQAHRSAYQLGWEGYLGAPTRADRFEGTDWMVLHVAHELGRVFRASVQIICIFFFFLFLLFSGQS